MECEEAKALVLQRLRERGVGGPDGVAIIESCTVEKSYGWIFFYNSLRYVQTGELIYSLVGQGPVIVIAESREIIELGSALPPEVAIRVTEEQRGLV